MNVNQVSDIIELEDTFHILKLQSLMNQKLVSLDEMSKTIINDLINSESLALMNDDYDLIDEMIFSNESIESIGESISKNLDESEKAINFNFEIDDFKLKILYFHLIRN